MARVWCPPPVRQLWLYRQTDRAVWQVGFFEDSGSWWVESSHTQSAAATDRVHWLNGGPAVDLDPSEQLAQAEAEVARLQAQVAGLVGDRDKWQSQARRCARQIRQARRIRRGQR